jgi:hypothetical protein
VVSVAPVVVPVLVAPPVNDDPPVVDVLAVVEFEVPPPPVAPVPLEPVFELALELPVFAELELEFELPVADDELAAVSVVAVVCVAALAALVVGTVSCGAPVVSVLLLPLPPHAAIATATSTEAQPATRRRHLRLCVR